MKPLALSLDALKIRSVFLLGLFIGLSFLIYFPALHCGFELDAHYVVEHNPVIKQPGALQAVFEEGFFGAYKNSFNPQLNYYRPITLLSFALNYQFLGHEPMHYRLINIILHGLNSFLVFLFIYLLFKNKMLGISTGFIFCVLPVHEWVVNYIVGRGDLLQTFFSLAALLCFLTYLSRRHWAAYLFSMAFFILALLSREVAMLFPLTVTLLGIVFFQCGQQKEKGNVKTINQYISHSSGTVSDRDIKRHIIAVSAPFYILAFVYYLLRQRYFPIINAEFLSDFSLMEIVQWLKLCIQYTIRFIFPWSVFSSWGPYILNVWFGLAMIAGITFGLFQFSNRSHQKERRIVVGFCLVWLLLGWLSLWPTRHAFVKQGYYLAEHFLYFSGIGWALLVAYVCTQIDKIKGTLLVVVIGLLYGTAVFMSSRTWTTEESLLRRVYQKEKSKEGVAYRQLVFRFEKDPALIKEMIIKSQDDTERSQWSKQLGRIYSQQNRVEEAIKILKQSIEYNPNNLEAMLELALCYLNRGEFKEGKDWLERIIKMDAEYGEAYRVLGEALYMNGKYGEAAKNLEKALSLDPDYETILEFLALSYYFDNKKSDYLRMLSKIETSVTDMKGMMRFFIREFYKHHQYGQVIDLVQANEKLFEKDTETLNVLAAALFNSGKKTRGRQVWRYVLSIDPENADALRGMMLP